jgi:hypothetical protein
LLGYHCSWREPSHGRWNYNILPPHPQQQAEELKRKSASNTDFTSHDRASLPK